ncbi:hypothetical protein GGI03_002495 [Coemansia sp. RSA 2337]|nr:hypothetical protein H4S03_005337 [Coemansia sp. S3946]KAJ2041543.1 hypothetical protein H4S04_007663 [Coemansia sp. S16]KAJ2073489.1 hypothetical protein GGH13_001958 [Coemansia sp. S155-1]KAJ2100106.1 hypothetical protein IW146_009635 [Coemansia sp. RSA 922]KAJ2342576.1 hypothetical protein GGH92_005316 [Coemansia sp. RSA 2673]KAJ2423111.1 hypothetical protein GGF41_003260 [Coemansia sp. RSA 2531]KAJ2465737.1 hypothetical protein GGI03_002495 [Coemansia sp. RSA 2337]
MLNHTQDGDAPGVPEPSRTQELEMTRAASSQESHSRDLVVQQAQEIAAIKQRVTALKRKVAKIKPAYIGQRQTIATLERTVDALRQSLSSQQQTGISHDQVLATLSHALAGNQKTLTTLQQTINAQQQTVIKQRFQLDNQARRIDASNLLLARATPLNAPTAGTTTFGDARAVGVPAFDVSALIAPAASTTMLGNAPAVSISDLDISALVAPAAGATMLGNAPAIGVSDLDISALVAPAANAPALVAPTAGASTFSSAHAAGVLDLDISALVAPAALTFGDAPATGATTFGVAPAVGVSAFGAPAACAPTFGITPVIGVSDLIAPAAGATTFGIAPTAGVLDRDISALVAPAADYSAFAAPAAGVLDRDISALIAPAAGATTFGVAPAARILDRDISALVTPATSATTFGNAPAVGVSAFGVAPTVDVPTVDMRVSNSVTAAELLRMIYDVSGMVFDVSGEQVTSERLLVVLGEAPYVSLGYVLDAYRHIYGCALMPRTTSSQYRIATLARVVALEHWAPQLDEEDPAHVADLNILCRRDLELGALRQNYREQLGLANDPNAAVLGPRLCYVIVKMISMSVDLLTGPVLRSMFMDATGLDLHSLNVVAEKGVQQMGAHIICQMVESWVGNIVKFIADDGNGLEGALSMATDCNALYVTRCSNGSSNGTEVAMGMLMNNVLYSTLFLGNGEAKWEALFRCLTFVTGKNTSSYAKECLEQLSKSLQVQPSS